MRSHTWIRTIYLYTFSLLGLVLMIIGSVRILDLGLKAFVFTRADEQERIFMKEPPFPHRVFDDVSDVEQLAESGGAQLSSEQRELVGEWLANYEVWKERQKDFDPVASRRQKDASSSIAFIIIGLPVFLYHWRTIRRESG